MNLTMKGQLHLMKMFPARQMRMRTVRQSTDDMSDGENEIDPWATLIDDAMSIVREDYKELLQTFIKNGQDERTAKKNAFEKILPRLQRELAGVYLDNLRWVKALKRDPVHKRSWKLEMHLSMKTTLITMKLYLQQLTNGSFC